MPESTRSSTAAESLWITVLAGGVGARFWPASTPRRPKQLLPLAGPRPLVAETVDRARSVVPDARIRILAGERLLDPFRAVLPDLPDSVYMVEPVARGTAPALAWAAWHIVRDDPDAVIASLHADHAVSPTGALSSLLRDAAALATRERLLLTVGVPPTRPEIGFGYIQAGAAIEDAGGLDAHHVAAFHEKPDAETAAAYLDAGHLWNSGIFVWRADTFLDEVRRHAPEIGKALGHLEAGDDEAFFKACPRVSVDVAVLERSDRVGTVRATFQWDDLGSWEALHRSRTPDAEGNVVVGEATVFEARDNVVYAEGAPVVLFGVEGLVVVRTGGVTLVATRESSPGLKRLLDHVPEHLRKAVDG